MMMMMKLERGKKKEARSVHSSDDTTCKVIKLLKLPSTK